MASAVALFSIVGGDAKVARRERAVSTPQSSGLAGKILNLYRTRIAPRSTFKNLASDAGVSPRSIEYWSNSRGLSSEALANLIRSEEGFKVLEAIMEGAQPKWWRICLPMMGLAEAREMQLRARRKFRRAVQGAIDADESLAASISKTEAAMPFQDEEFLRPHLDAQRAMARAASGTVDRQVKK